MLIFKILVSASDEGAHPPGWVVPQGDKVLTLKARGVLIEGSLKELYEELYMTRRAAQHVIDSIWELEKLPSLSQLHHDNHRLAQCRKCGLIVDRDTIGAMNIHLRAQRIMWRSQGSPLNAPAMKNENRQSGRTKMRERKSYQFIKVYNTT